MSPPLNDTAPSRRQSCDRCHNQKVRCTRSDNRKTGACDRCLRKGEQCEYSSCLPKGRPSLYRLDEVPTGSRGRATSIRTTSNPPVAPAPPDQQRFSDPGSGSPTDADVDHNIRADMDVDGDTFTFAGSIDTLADFSAQWRPEDHVVASPAFELDPALEAHQPLASLEFTGHFPSVPDWPSWAGGGGVGRGHTHHNGLGIGADSGKDSSTPSSSSRGSHVISIPSKNGSELSIAHLSRLSTHLSQLLGPSRSFLAETMSHPSRPSTRNQDPTVRAQHAIKAVFKSTHAWLVQESTNADAILSFNPGPANSSDLLHYVFSASHQLLEIMRHVRASTGPNTPRFFTPASCSPTTGSNLSSDFVGEQPTTPGPHSLSVVRHLILACMTTLLNIYIAILIALQRSAEELSSPLRRRPGHHFLVEPGDDMDAASRVHLQLVAAVQLCSYFIRRLKQTWGTIMSSSDGGALHTPRPLEHDAWQSASEGAITDLKTEVEQRLRRLQESLEIFP